MDTRLGFLDEEQTQRLWSALPLAVEALVRCARPDRCLYARRRFTGPGQRRRGR